eukprot:scaffold55130_cov90-Phaeocystis_antarctica.AAC.1
MQTPSDAQASRAEGSSSVTSKNARLACHVRLQPGARTVTAWATYTYGQRAYFYSYSYSLQLLTTTYYGAPPRSAPVRAALLPLAGALSAPGRHVANSKQYVGSSKPKQVASRQHVASCLHLLRYCILLLNCYYDYDYTNAPRLWPTGRAAGRLRGRRDLRRETPRDLAAPPGEG